MFSSQTLRQCLAIGCILGVVFVAALTVQEFTKRDDINVQGRHPRSPDVVDPSKQGSSEGVAILEAPAIPRTPASIGTLVMTTTEPTATTQTDTTPGVTKATTSATTIAMGTEMTTATGTDAMRTTESATTVDSETDVTQVRTTSAVPGRTTAVVGTEVYTTTPTITPTTSADVGTNASPARTTLFLPTLASIRATASIAPTTLAATMPGVPTTTEGPATDQTVGVTSTLPSTDGRTAEPTTPTTTAVTTEKDVTTESDVTTTTMTTTAEVTTMRSTTLRNVIGPIPGDRPPTFPPGWKPWKKYFFRIILRYLWRVWEEVIREDIEKIFCPYYRERFPDAFIECKVSDILFPGPFARYTRSIAAETNVSVTYDVIYDASSEVAELSAETIYEQSGLKGDIDNGVIEGNFTVVAEPCEFDDCGEEDVNWCENAECDSDFTPDDDGSGCACQSKCRHAFCRNEGICEHSEAGISCSCRSGNGWTYIGEQCDQIWYINYTILIFVSVLILMLLTTVVLVIYCLKRRRKDIQQAKMKATGKWFSSKPGESWLSYFNEAFQPHSESPADHTQETNPRGLESTWISNRSSGYRESSEAPSIEMGEWSPQPHLGQSPGSGDLWTNEFPETSLQTAEGMDGSARSGGEPKSPNEGLTYGMSHMYAGKNAGENLRPAPKQAATQTGSSNQPYKFNPTVSNIDPNVEIRIKRPTIVLRQPYSE